MPQVTRQTFGIAFELPRRGVHLEFSTSAR
jgi:hypothetical protein